MAIAQMDLDTLNAAIVAARDALGAVLDGMAAGEELVWTPNSNEPIVGEDLGTGNGMAGSGAVSGDFTLSRRLEKVDDLSSVTVAGTEWGTVVPVGGALGSGNSVEVVIGHDATSGDLQFFTNGGAVDVTGDVLASYKPLREEPAAGVEIAGHKIVLTPTAAATLDPSRTAENDQQGKINIEGVLGVGTFTSADAV